MEANLASNLVQRVNVADCLRRSAALYGHRMAIADEHRSISYRDLHADVNRLARGLLNEGVARGDFVGLLFRNCIEFFTCYFACARIGAVALPLNPRLRSEDQQKIFEQVHPRILIVQADYTDEAVDLAAKCPSLRGIAIAKPGGTYNQPPFVVGGRCTVGALEKVFDQSDADVEVIVEDRDTVQCLFSSGTTGTPKGILAGHSAVVFTAISGAVHMRITDLDRGLVVMPVHHVGGLCCAALPHLLVGASVILADAWDPAKVAALMAAEGVTNALLTAPMWIEIAEANKSRRFDWSKVKLCVVAIATLPPERARDLRALFPNADILLGAGQTEFTGYQEGQRREHQLSKPTAWGDPTLLTDVAIMDEDGNLLGPDVVGEIVYRGPQAMTGYFGDRELTDESFRFGWFHSGDLGYRDSEHTIFFVDRKKHMIKTGGENVSSIEVTHALMTHPSVVDCAVVGLPHPRWTEAITGFVKAAADAKVSEAQLIDHCRRHLAGFMVPKRIVFVDDFPRTASTKIQKHLLVERYRDLYS